MTGTANGTTRSLNQTRREPLREAARKIGGEATDHLLLALSAIVYDSANIKLGRLQTAFKDRSGDTIEPLVMFESAAAKVIHDLRTKVRESHGNVTIVHGDSRSMDGLPGSPGAVFCSPPYPNRYSYIWNTRPHLYLLELIETAAQATDIDCETIGGTWGRATTQMQKGWVHPSDKVRVAMGSCLEELEAASTFMRNYCCKYFNDLDTHLAALRERLGVGVPIGYVVGNSETNGVMVETQHILGELMSLNGFELMEIESLRARNSGAGLVEATVTAIAR